MHKEYSEEFIQQLKDNINIVDYISQYVELKKASKNLIGLCPLHEENTDSFMVFPETNSFHCFGCHRGSNIIDFVMEYHKLSFPKAIEYLSNYTGLEQGEIKPIPETIKFLKQFNKKKRIEEVEHIILPENIMDKYSKTPILEWVWEGIDQEVMDKYQVRYDESAMRAVFPIWDNDGNIINAKGRTMLENFKDLGLKKYIHYHKLGTNDFLYPLHFKRDAIKEAGEVIIVESEKSVWKLDGWGIKNSVALCTSNINEYQLKLLLGLKTNVIFGLDKDVDYNRLKDKIQLLKRFTNVYALIDKGNLLDDKDAPCDKTKEVFLELYRDKYKL